MMTTLLAAVVVGVLSFYGGMKYQQSKQPGFAGNFRDPSGRFMMRGASGASGFRGGASGFRPVNGEIIAVDDTSITVKQPDGSGRIVLVSQTTEINKADTAAKSDLTVGKRVMVVGTSNSDGSVTAQNIQINPLLRMPGASGASGVNR